MILWRHFRVDVLHPAVRADEVRDPPGPVGLRGVVRAVGLADVATGIADELERIAELLREGAVRFDRIEARAEDDGVGGIEVADSITESVAFDRSTRGIGGRIPPEQDVLAGEIRQLHARAVVRRKVEVGSEIAFVQHAPNVAGSAVRT
jgi:hypothetical protein